MALNENRTLYVGNLSERVTEELLYELFLQGGPVNSVKIPPVNSRRRPYGLVEFKHECSTAYAQRLFQNVELYNRRLDLKYHNNRFQVPLVQATPQSQCFNNPDMVMRNLMDVNFFQGIGGGGGAGGGGCRTPVSIPPLMSAAFLNDFHLKGKKRPPPPPSQSQLHFNKNMMMPSPSRKKIREKDNNDKDVNLPDSIDYGGLIIDDDDDDDNDNDNGDDNQKNEAQNEKGAAAAVAASSTTTITNDLRNKIKRKKKKKYKQERDNDVGGGGGNNNNFNNNKGAAALHSQPPPPKSYIKSAVNHIRQHCARNNRGSYDLSDANRKPHHSKYKRFQQNLNGHSLKSKPI